MEVQPVDVVALFGVLVGGAVVILPMLGLVLRFSIKPVLEAYARAFPDPTRMQREFDRLERRVRELEETLDAQRAAPAPRQALGGVAVSSVEHQSLNGAPLASAVRASLNE